LLTTTAEIVASYSLDPIVIFNASMLTTWTAM